MTKLTFAMFEAATERSSEASMQFAAGICGIIALFIIYHWTAVLLKRRKGGKAGALTKTVRFGRSAALRRLPVFRSVGHAVVFTAYFAIVLTISFTNLNWSDESTRVIFFAKRLGWVCTVNLVLIAFLALKNTPLAFLTAHSYDQLNILHRMAGYVTVLSMLFHSFVEIASNVQNNRTATFKEFGNIMGSIASMCMLIMGITALLLRKMQYETFYTIHITLFLLCIIATALHHPDLDGLAIWAMVFVGAIWSLDRLLRIARISYYAAANNATITALPNGGIRIVMKRSSIRAVAGSHIFLWIPSIRAFETHPFTISETSPLTVVVKAHDGFTKSLLKKATENPGAVLRASMEGPYGIVPNLSHFDYFIFIAGGSGATYTFGLACDLVRRLGPDSQTVIDFVWSVRNEDALTWFKPELAILRTSRNVRLNIHVTNASTPSSPSLSSPVTSTTDFEKDVMSTITNSSPSSSTADIEKDIMSSITSPISTRSFAHLPGRPDLPALIRGGVANATQLGASRVLLAACGPMEMLHDVKPTAADCIKSAEVSIEMHLENFGW